MPKYEFRPDIPKKLGFKNWAEVEEIGEENLRKQQEWWEAGGKYQDGLLQSMASSSRTEPQRHRAAVNRKESEGEAQSTAKSGTSSEPNKSESNNLDPEDEAQMEASEVRAGLAEDELDPVQPILSSIAMPPKKGGKVSKDFQNVYDRAVDIINATGPEAENQASKAFDEAVLVYRQNEHIRSCLKASLQPSTTFPNGFDKGCLAWWQQLHDLVKTELDQPGSQPDFEKKLDELLGEE